MPRHVLIMWLLAGGGTLAGATLTYMATRPVLAPATNRITSGYRRLRSAFPSIFSRRSQVATDRLRTTPARHFPSSSNSAFNEYRTMQIAALEHEEQEFHSFLQRLRDARDREEFENYVSERKRAPRNTVPTVIDNES